MTNLSFAFPNFLEFFLLLKIFNQWLVGSKAKEPWVWRVDCILNLTIWNTLWGSPQTHSSSPGGPDPLRASWDECHSVPHPRMLSHHLWGRDGIFSESSPGSSDVHLPLRAILEMVLLYLKKKFFFYNAPEILRQGLNNKFDIWNSRQLRHYGTHLLSFDNFWYYSENAPLLLMTFSLERAQWRWWGGWNFVSDNKFPSIVSPRNLFWWIFETSCPHLQKNGGFPGASEVGLASEIPKDTLLSWVYLLQSFHPSCVFAACS